jgi:hypothetical protein
MNIQRLFSLQLLLCLGLLFKEAHSFVTASGEIKRDITQTFLHKRAGTWAIGSTGGNDEAIISVALQLAGGAAAVIPTSVTGTDVGEGDRESITALTVCDTSSADDNNVRIVYVKSESPTELHVTSDNGASNSIVAGVIKNAFPSDITAIAALASNEFDTIMMAVSRGNWGENNSGICYATLSDNAENTLEYVGREIGETAALTLDESTEQVNGGTGANSPTISPNNPVIHWCKNLNRWYVGIQGATGAANNDAIKVLSAYSINTENNNRIESIPLVNNDHITPLFNGTDADNSNIVGCTHDGNTGETSYSILKIDSMFTTTGKDYLIVQGGLGTNAENPSRQIFALPLVGKTGDVPGALAHIDTPNDNPKVSFSKTAIDDSFLYTEESFAAQVGQGQLPVTPAENVITQMMVIGDAVYCSVATEGNQTGTNISGLYYSQAEFDHTGQIVGWSLWAQALPNEASGKDIQDGSCSFFAVDAISGKIWTTPTDDLTAVRLSQWEQPKETDTFVGSVNALLEGPCYSQLTLNKTLSNYNQEQAAQFSLFGGNNKVVIVRTGEKQTGNNNVLTTVDWTDDNNKAVDISLGLEKVGAVNTLGFTNNQTHNYLLAGTNGGLYAFVKTDTEASIDISNNSDVLNTDSDLFTGTHSWKHVNAIGNEPVVKIVTMDRNNAPVTFVLTHGAHHKLWRLSGNQTDLTGLNETALLVWEADPLDNSSGLPCFFYDIASINGTDDQNGSTLLLATNTGLYKAVDPVADDAVNFSQLNLPSEYNSITSLFTQNGGLSPQTVYYTRQVLRQAPGGGWAPAVRSSLGQISFDIDPTFNDLSQYYQALNGDKIAQGNIPLGSSIKSFFTDGGRRFYIEQVEGDSKNGCTLHTAPFYSNISGYNINEVDDLGDAAIATSNTFYWVNNMGAGYLVAGTDNGIIALQ